MDWNDLKRQSLQQAAQPLIEWLKVNTNPHTKILVDDTHVEVLMGELMVSSVIEKETTTPPAEIKIYTWDEMLVELRTGKTFTHSSNEWWSKQKIKRHYSPIGTGLKVDVLNFRITLQEKGTDTQFETDLSALMENICRNRATEFDPTWYKFGWIVVVE